MKNSYANSAVRLPDVGGELLRDLVHEQTGLYFEDDKIDVFLAKLSPLIGERAGSLMDYFYLLKYDSGSMEEWGKLFDALTVQESFFWRETEQIRLLVDEIVPQFFKAHPDRILNIWSAACAAGCEPLTIAMALEEAGWFDRGRIHIFACDASARAIEAARNGVYREHSFTRLPPALREKYFVCDGSSSSGGKECLSRVSNDLHSRVSWKKSNLMSDADLAMVPVTSPVIFCRNVFIYFSEYAVRKTIRAFAQTMPRPGYLFVGMAESLMKTNSDFELREIGETFVHVRS